MVLIIRMPPFQKVSYTLICDSFSSYLMPNTHYVSDVVFLGSTASYIQLVTKLAGSPLLLQRLLRHSCWEAHSVHVVLLALKLQI